MKFRHLKIFVCVCEEMNMTKAGQKLFISQSSISQAISELETYYNVQLFERLSRKIYLTEAGEALLSYAYHIISLTKELEETMKYQSLHRKIRIGATITIGTYCLSPMIQHVKEMNPNIFINSLVDNTAYIEENLLNSKLDLGLVEGKIKSQDIIVEPFLEDELILVCSDQHPLSKKKSLTIEELQNQSFLVREEGSGSRALFIERMNRKGVAINITGEFNNTEAIKNATACHLGIGVISKKAIDDRDDNLKVLDVEGLDLKRDFSIAYHKNKYVSGELGEVIKLFLNRQVIGKLL